MPGEHHFHLTGLDPVATDLDLLVAAAQEFKGPVVEPAGEIARTVEPRPRLRAPGIGQKTFGGPGGLPQVTAPRRLPPREKLADHSQTRQGEPRSDDVDAGPGDGPSDRRVDDRRRHVDGDDVRFGRPIMVLEDGRGMLVEKPFYSRRPAKRLSGHGDEP